MESIIVYPKNSMEMTALKRVLKDMNINFEKNNHKNTSKSPKTEKKIFEKKFEKSVKNVKNNPNKGV